MSGGPSDASTPRPTPEDLLALDADRWARVIAATRRVLNTLDEPLVTPEFARLRALPTSRLASGRGRDRLARAVMSAPLWPRVREELEGGDDTALTAWLGGSGPHPVRHADEGTRAEGFVGPEPAPADVGGELQRLKDRARGFQEERDELQRRLDGAEARASTAEERAAELEERLAAGQDRLAELEEALDRAEEERLRAVDRERRRNDAEVSTLEDDLSRARRALHEQEQELKRLREVVRARGGDRTGGPEVAPPGQAARDPGGGVVPGRPTRVPDRIERGTREYAEAVLERGRVVLVDGYNLTLTRREHLDIGDQRAWLVRLLSAAAAARGIRPTVVFDGDGLRGGNTSRGRGVTVVFSGEHEADDDIVFRVAALPENEPVTVVTDDRELRERLHRYGADVIGTGPFLWAVE